MECPLCKKKMRIARKDRTGNPKTGKEYARNVYVCDKDDVWLTIELPELS